jgi:uncharacterized repeat protein (TIGR01451 family)
MTIISQFLKTQALGTRVIAALFLAIIAAGVVALSPAHAQGKSAVALESVIEVETKDAAGASTYGSPAKGTVVPGDNLRFSIYFANTTDEPASALSVTNPIPTAVEFVSVQEDWALLSVDGGKTFGALTGLTVSETNAEGVVGTRAATPADVTHIRWKLDRPLAPQEKGSLQFFGRVK